MCNVHGNKLGIQEVKIVEKVTNEVVSECEEKVISEVVNEVKEKDLGKTQKPP